MKKFTRQRTQGMAPFAVGLVVLYSLIIFLKDSPRGELVTQKFFDPIRYTTERKEAVIVGVDDKSLQALGSWPFNRTVFANLTNALQKGGAQEIIYDVLFLEKRDGDKEFSQALQNSQANILLASKVTDTGYLESFLVAKPTTTSAFAHIYPSDDGEVRTIPHNMVVNGTCVASLSDKAFTIFTHRDSLCDTEETLFFRYVEHIQTVSLVDVLNGVTGVDFKNKVVFIGSNSLDLEDHFISIHGEKVPGVSLHVSIFTTLLNNDTDRNLGKGSTNIIILILALFVTYFSYRITTFLRQLSFFALVVVGVFLFGYALFEYHYIIALPFLLLTAVVCEGYTVLFRFITERKKNEYISRLFSKYVHKDILHELLLSGKDIVLGGEKKRISILFSDLRGFTTFSETMSPGELTKLLNDYLSAMSPIILDNKGTIDKYIGDAIMAFWNAPLDIKDHENKTVFSALSMQQELARFNKEHATQLAMGIGINTGDVVVGNVGSEERINYTILGDTVNTTSRLEGLTKKYGIGIIAGEEIKNAVTDTTILFRKLDVITVKGKSETTVIYEPYFAHDKDEKIITGYEKAFSLYEKGEFRRAKEILQTQTEDAPSQTLLERIVYIENHPEFSFDGVWHFDEK